MFKTINMRGKGQKNQLVQKKINLIEKVAGPSRIWHENVRKEQDAKGITR